MSKWLLGLTAFSLIGLIIIILCYLFAKKKRDEYSNNFSTCDWCDCCYCCDCTGIDADFCCCSDGIDCSCCDCGCGT